MPLLDINKTYADGEYLVKADLDRMVNPIIELLNTTKLDTTNISMGDGMVSTSGESVRPDLDGTTLTTSGGAIKVVDGDYTWVLSGTYVLATDSATWS